MKYLSNLFAEAGIQDNLLQSYRSFQLIMQSIFIAIGTGLSIAIITTSDMMSLFLILTVLLSVAILAIYSLMKIRRVIISRGLDVDYWHNKIIEAEKELPSDQRFMTLFKVCQKFHRNNIDENEFQKIILREETLSSLTEKGKGHTRKVLDNNLFYGFLIIWIVFLAVSIFKIVSFVF